MKRSLTTVLPVEYQPITYVRPSLAELYGIGLGALFIFAWLFALMYWLVGRRPGLDVPGSGAIAFLVAGGILLGGFVVVAFLHELTHGLALRALGYRPVMGVGPGYAYCTVQDIFLTRDQFFAVSAVPLVFLSALGVLAMVIVPSLSTWLMAFLVCNAAACVGDLWMMYLVGHFPSHVYVADHKDGLEIFGQQGDAQWALSNHLVKDFVKGFFVSLLLLFISSEGSLRLAVRFAHLSLLTDARGAPLALLRLSDQVSGTSSSVVLVTMVAICGLLGIGYALLRSVTRE